MKIVALIVLCLAIGLISGYLLGKRTKKRIYGYLRVDHSDPSDPPLLFLELKTDVETISKEKEVSFKVKLEDFVPHK